MSKFSHSSSAKSLSHSAPTCCLSCTPYKAHQQLEMEKFEKKNVYCHKEEQCEVVKDVQKDAQFGSRVAMAKHGNVLAVSAPLYDVTQKDGTVVENNGAVFIFERAEEHGTQSTHKCKPKWIFRQRLVQKRPYTCEKELQGGATAEMFNFGQSIALSEDGFYIVVGAPLQDDTGDEDESGGGAVYVYARCPTKKGKWVPVSKLTAQKFEKKESKEHGCYSEKTKQVSDAESGAMFGFDVDISRDGGKILVGAPFQDGDGAAYVFCRSSAGGSNVTTTFSRRCSDKKLFHFKQKLVRPTLDGVNDTTGGTMFGFNVALSGFGDLAAISKPSLDLGANASFVDAGAVCIFEKSYHCPTFKFVQLVRLEVPDLMMKAFFGTGLRLTPDKRFLLVEASAENKPVVFGDNMSIDVEIGSVYVFERKCVKDAHKAVHSYVQVAKLCPDFSGTDIDNALNAPTEMSSFDVSDDGCVVAVGYEGVGDGVSHDHLKFEGAVVVYRSKQVKNKSIWTQSELLRPFDGESLKLDANREHAAFGASVTMSGDSKTLVVGESTSVEDQSDLFRDDTFAYSFWSECRAYIPHCKQKGEKKEKKKRKY